jgi:hypothetical protein
LGFGQTPCRNPGRGGCMRCWGRCAEGGRLGLFAAGWGTGEADDLRSSYHGPGCLGSRGDGAKS